MASGYLYQPIMIYTLNQAKNGEATKDQIKDAIKAVNHHKLPRNNTKYPWDILTKKHKVTEFDKAKKVYRLLDFDTYTAGQKSAISKYCKKKINPNSNQKVSAALAKGNVRKISKEELEKLIIAFDKDKNLFDLNRDLAILQKTRDDFVSKFPVKKISSLKLEQYAPGKLDSATNKGDNNTFAWWLERRKDGQGAGNLGKMGVHGAQEYGIYWDKIKKQYVKTKSKNNIALMEKKNIKTVDKLFIYIKDEIIKIIQAADDYSRTGNREELINKIDIHDKERILTTAIRTKILFIYFPEHFLALYSFSTFLKPVMQALGFPDNEIKDKKITLQFKLIDLKNSHHIMKNWNHYDYSHFLWNLYKKIRDETTDQIPPESEIYKKIMNYVGVE